MHTHSTYATAWAARGEPIPCVLTMLADEFGGEIPVGPFALIGDDSIGRGIVETLRTSRSPAVLMRNHGPSPIGPTPRAAVKAAVMVEDVARTVHIARQLGEPTADRAGRRRRALRPLPERLRPGRDHADRRRFVSEPADLVPHRQPAPVRPRGRSTRWPTTPDASPPHWTPPTACPCRVVLKPVLTETDAIRRALRRGQRRRQLHRRDRLDAHVQPREDVDHRSRPAAQAAAPPPHPGEPGAAVGRDRHGLHEPQPGRARRPGVRRRRRPGSASPARPSPATSPTPRSSGGSACGRGPRSAGPGCRRMRLARFGDNMRNVAVTEGDKVEARAPVRRLRQHLGRERPGRGRRRRAGRRRSTRWSSRVRRQLRRRAGAASGRGPPRLAALRRPDRGWAFGLPRATAGSVRSPRTSRTSAGCASCPGSRSSG